VTSPEEAGDLSKLLQEKEEGNLIRGKKLMRAKFLSIKELLSLSQLQKTGMTRFILLLKVL
jgi:hypothetical protein